MYPLLNTARVPLKDWETALRFSPLYLHEWPDATDLRKAIKGTKAFVWHLMGQLDAHSRSQGRLSTYKKLTEMSGNIFLRSKQEQPR